MSFQRFLQDKQRLRRSVQQERGIAKDVGGRRVAGSGNQPGNKGDVDADRWRIEAKQTVKPSYSLKLAEWRKIETAAIRASKSPVMIVEMAGRKLAVIDYNDWLALIAGELH